jgi:fucose permease
MATPPATRTRLTGAALATAVVFFASGAAFATWVSRLPATRDRLDVSTAALGLALLMPGLGSLATMPFTGRLCQRFGSRAVVTGMALPAVALLAVLARLPSIVSVGAALLVWGALYGSWDVAMNVHGSAVELAAGRAWMPRYHASWSVGGITGAGLGALAAKAGLGVSAHFAIAAGVLAAALVVALRFFVDERSLAATEDPAPDSSDDRAQRERKTRLITVNLVLIGVVTLCGTCIEGAAADWLALFLTDERAASDSIAAGGYTIFALAMATSRFLGTPIIERIGRAGAVRIAGFVTGAGILVAVLAPGVAGSYAGAFLWGAGVALVFPAAMSAGGEVPNRSADAIAAVSTIGYAGFLVGPPLIGVLAEHVGLGEALLVLLVLAAGIAVLAPATRPRTVSESR